MPRANTAVSATAAYIVLTLVMTWPLARGLARDVPSDLGDPLLNMWILAWDAEQLRAMLGGDLGRLVRFFDANIFYPARLTLAYSEHLFAQALQVFPVYLATGNPILCYNLVLLSTFVLSGLGGFLFVREITASARAGFVAGLLLAFAPFRWSHLSHVQVLSAQWMPFALYGFRRYFDTGRRRPLIGAAIALALQNLSCGYYLLYFAPVVVGYVLWEIATRRAWRSPRVWKDLTAAALGVLAVTLPFLLPYTHLRDSLRMSRDLSEVINYSADVYSYFTAFYASNAWGKVAGSYPKDEGALFPGLIPLLLPAIGILAWATRSVTAPTDSAAERVSRWLPLALLGASAAYILAAAVVIFTRRLDLDIAFVSIRASNATRLILISLICAVALAWVSPRWRARMVAAAARPEAIFVTILFLAWWLSLGPSPRALGRPLRLWSPYQVLYDFIPGFDGLRAPARFAMIVTLALSVLGGLAVARLPRRTTGTLVLIALCAGFLLEVRLTSFPLNGGAVLRDYATPERRVYRPDRAPAVYRELARLAADAVVLEMPMGDPQYDLLAVYYSTAHWRRLVNGYSGYFPPHYARLWTVLSGVARGDDVAWEALSELQVTHVVVHEGAYLNDEGARFAEWLRVHGAAETFRDGRDVLFALPH